MSEASDTELLHYKSTELQALLRARELLSKAKWKDNGDGNYVATLAINAFQDTGMQRWMDNILKEAGGYRMRSTDHTKTYTITHGVKDKLQESLGQYHNLQPDVSSQFLHA
jgi:hypothetical protein